MMMHDAPVCEPTNQQTATTFIKQKMVNDKVHYFVWFNLNKNKNQVNIIY